MAILKETENTKYLCRIRKYQMLCWLHKFANSFSLIDTLLDIVKYLVI
jgi:hypothetical protein